MLWMIGQNDRRSSEFHYCDTIRQYGLWNLSPKNLTFTVGESSEKTDWYYAQTQKDGTWTIKFNLDKTYSGKAHLTASLAGCTGNGSTVAVKVNGTQRGTWKPGVNDAAIYRSAVNSGRHHLLTLDFDASTLRQGSNTIALTMSGNGSNGGFMYDCIKLEAGDVVTGLELVREADAAVAKPVKRLVNGRLVIEKYGRRYAADGTIIRKI